MITQPLADQDILAAAKSLPAAPQIMARLHAMLTDINSGLSQIATLLRRDAALTARIIAIANSPAYGAAGSIGSIEEALQRVGFGEVFRLVGVVANRSVAAQVRAYGWTAGQVSNHNLFAALLCEGLARRAKQDSRTAYTAGLLQTIGMVLLDRVGSGTVYDHETFQESGAGNLLAWEERTFGLTHHRVNGILYRSWGFPEAMVEAAQNHETPLGRIVTIAGGILRTTEYALPEDRGPQGPSTEDLAALSLDIDDVERVVADARAAFQGFSAL